jgi:predicted dehydrogenase
MTSPSATSRRRFLKHSAALTATLAAAPTARVLGAQDRVRLGFMGLGGRGINLAKMFARRNDCEIAWFCDPDRRRWARAEASLDPAPAKPLQFAQDFREILDDRSVDALVVATPDHWHGPATIMACQAGKDVYVEKPASHNAREGRLMIQAARQYHRVVQVGTQSRSAPYVQAARQLIVDGRLGDIRVVRVFNLMEHPAVPLGDPAPVPEGFDYDLWCGPAAKLPFIPNRRWLNFSEFSCGPIPGDAIHQLDLARFLMGDPQHPKSVSHMGGIDVLRDGRDTPDTQLATYDYGAFKLLFQAALWSPYMQKTPMGVRDTDHFPNWSFSSTKLEILGTRAFLVLGRHGGGFQLFDRNQQLLVSEHGRQADREHQDNFMACIRSRQNPQADIAQGHASTLLCHLANAAWRAGNRTLQFDPNKEVFLDTPEANAFLRRTYREPWQLPDRV